MAEHEAAQVDEEPEATAEDASAEEASAEDASAEDSGMADAVDNRAAELTGGSGGDGGGDDQPISEINRPAVDAAAAHLDDTNLDADRETLKKVQKGM
jgi:hypothetical protein